MKISIIKLLTVFLVVSFLFYSFNSFAGAASKRIALIIAIGDYQDEDGWSSFNIDKDIEYILKGLDLIGFESDTTQNDQYKSTFILKNKDATKEAIIKRLEDIAARYYSPGSVVYIHFLGHGCQLIDDNNDEDDGYDEAIVPWNAPKRLSKDKQGDEKFIRDDELIKLINKIREKVGPTGQVVFSLDASYFGPEKGEILTSENKSILARGGFFEINETKNISTTHSAFILITATISDEMAYDTKDSLGDSVGAFTLAFYYSLLNTDESTRFITFHENIKIFMRINAINQSPAITGDVSEVVFNNAMRNKKSFRHESNFSTRSGDFKLSGDLYILSIGIDNYYHDRLQKFKNCKTDAINMAIFCKKEFNRISFSDSKVYSYTLTNENARKDSIIKYLNLIINNSKPDDFFIFNFAGYSFKDFDSNSQQSTTNFYTYYDTLNSLGYKDLEKISIHQLKDLLEFVAANNQLFITESGNTKDFQIDFVKALIESNPDVSKLTKKNRIIICPKGMGWDNFSCKDSLISGGPLVHFLTLLPANLNFFNLFYKSADLIVHHVNKKQIECDLFNNTYASFFFEREYLKEIEYLFPESMERSRGAEAKLVPDFKSIQKVGSKHALIIGINDYSKGKPMWRNLTNPTYDAKEIAQELQINYGFNVELLIDASSDDIFSKLKEYSNILGKNDQLFIFIAGHGDFDSLFFNDGFFVTSSSESTNSDPYRTTYISFSNIENIINNLPPKQIFLCLDVCFGGAFDEQVRKNRNRDKTEVYSNLQINEFVSNKIDLTTRLYMTSGSLNEVPDGYAGKHSPFAYKILEALRTYGGNEGIITSNQVFNFVERLPSKPMMGSFGNDEPGSAFFFIAKKKD